VSSGIVGISIAIDAVTASIIAVFLLFIVQGFGRKRYVVKKGLLLYLYAA